MLAAVGIKVRRLRRRRVAFLKLGALGPGEFRRLTGAEVSRLKKAAGRGSHKGGGRKSGGRGG